MRRTDDVELTESTTSDEKPIVHEAPSAPKAPTDVAKACYALALAVLDGNQEHARGLARVVLAAAIEKMSTLD